MNASPIRWRDYVASELGTEGWVVAGSLSPRHRALGFDKAVSQGRIDTLRRQWIDMHPGVLAALTYTGEKRAWLIDAARFYAEHLAASEVRILDLDHARTVEAHKQMCGVAA